MFNVIEWIFETENERNTWTILLRNFRKNMCDENFRVVHDDVRTCVCVYAQAKGGRLHLGQHNKNEPKQPKATTFFWYLL